MKNLISIILITFFTCKVSAQTADIPVWGSIQKNYPGGEGAYSKLITDSAVYPKLALANRVMGCVYLRFTIEKDGTLNDVKIFRGVGREINKDAIRLVQKSGKWLPSSINGKPVRTMCKAGVNYYILKANRHHGLYGVVDGNATNPRLLADTTTY